jgi:DNA-binding transcriptional MerR regulator
LIQGGGVTSNKNSYKIDELALEAQVSARTIRYYVQRGLLPAPAFHGKDTTYDKGHVLRLQVIKKLQQFHMPLDEIQARIGGASEDELERMLGAGPREGQGKGVYRFPGRGEPRELKGTERWERIHLRGGLELHLRSDAGPEARRAALEIQSKYGQGPLSE